MTDDAHPSYSHGAPGRLGRAFRTTFHSLGNRNFRLFFIGQTISNSGNWLTNVALTLLVLGITNSGVAVGILAACQYGPILLLSAWGGAIADRRDKRHLLMITQSLEMAQSAGLAILAFMPHPPIIGMYALALCGGVFLAFDSPPRRSFVTEMVPSEDIPNAVVLYSTIVNLSRILGPALAGLLVGTLGYGWCFALDAISYLAVLVCLAMMRPAELRRAPRKPRTKGDVREGFRYLLSVPALWISFAMLAAIGTLAYNFSVTLPLFVTGALHRGNSVFTMLYSTFSAGAVVCGLAIARRTRITMRQILYGSAMFGVAMLLLSAVPGVGTATLAIFLVGVTGILYMNGTTAIVQVRARQDMHGRLLSLQTILIGGTSAIGGPLLGWIADIAGARALMVLGGVTCLVSTIFGYVAIRHYREQIAAPQEK